jgi:hypothetical protein
MRVLPERAKRDVGTMLDVLSAQVAQRTGPGYAAEGASGQAPLNRPKGLRRLLRSDFWWPRRRATGDIAQCSARAAA